MWDYVILFVKFAKAVKDDEIVFKWMYVVLLLFVGFCIGLCVSELLEVGLVIFCEKLL